MPSPGALSAGDRSDDVDEMKEGCGVSKILVDLAMGFVLKIRRL
jgi:hypothetical protein